MRETNEKKGPKWPTVVTVDKSGKEKTWGPLSRTAAWKAGCFWEMKGDAKVFLEKSGEKKEVSVEKLIGQDGPRFWFKDLIPDWKPDPPKEQPEKRLEDQSATEDAADDTTTEEAIPVMSEIDPGEVETDKTMWLSEKVTSLEKENGELRKALHEMQAKIELQWKRLRRWPNDTARSKRQSRGFGNKSDARTPSTKA